MVGEAAVTPSGWRCCARSPPPPPLDRATWREPTAARVLHGAGRGRRDVVTVSTNGVHADAPITHVSDEAWEAVQPILEQYDPPRRLGRKRIDQRRALDAIVYRIRSG